MDTSPFIFMLLAALYSTFLTSKNLTVKLVLLLMISLICPVQFMEEHKLFLPCGIFLVIMSTGLIVVFAYIVSLNSNESLSYSKEVVETLVFFILLMIFPAKMVKVYFSFSKEEIQVDLFLSGVMILILLLMIISVIRLIYSKGGGFRKKF